MPNHKSIISHQLPDGLKQEKANQTSRNISNNFSPLTLLLKQQFGESLEAIILYGSCLHSHNIEEGVVDFYVLVRDYKQAYERRYLRYLSAWLPPTVFYLEAKEANLKAKYAVISITDFEAGINKWFHSYLWARFAQPVRILYSRDADCEEQIHSLLAASVLTFLRNTLPVLGSTVVDVEEIWINGLTLSYAAELRPERHNRPRQLSHISLGDYNRLTIFAAPALGDKLIALKNNQYKCEFNLKEQKYALLQWRLRRWQGRVLSVLRLSKATFTFINCIDYAAWKIKRHTGVDIEITPRLRRFPILWGLKVLWSLLRKGVVR